MDEVPGFDGTLTFGYTRDLEATAAFYGGVLGLPLALDQGTCRIWRSSPGAYLGFCRRAEPPAPGGVILTLLADDVEGWEGRLRAAGIALEKRAQSHPDYGIFHLFCRDPNGYLVEIQRFDDPAWDNSGRSGSA